jgi:putative transposase
MTPEEQASVVAQRRERRYPLHAPPHPYREESWYLLTAVNFEHKPVMQAPERRDEFEFHLLEGFSSLGAEIAGWVILPNHYHILAAVPSLDIVSVFLKGLHGRTSREWNRTDGVTCKRRVWYKFTDRGIRGEKYFFRALNYMHYNPVKHGHTADPYAWLWSSVHLYYETRGRDWLRTTWRDYLPGAFGDGWDG